MTLVDEAFPEDSNDVRTWPECVRLISHALITANHAETLGIAAAVISHLLDKSGKYLQAKAEFTEAKTLFERALRLAEQEYGPNHATVAVRLNDLGFVLDEMGDLQEAKEHYERAFSIAEKEYIPNHANVSSRFNNRVFVLEDMVGHQDANPNDAR